MHVASFCDGATASQEVLADELLDLWNNPIELNGKKYYVMVSQILMDGPGRSKYCKCRPTTSHDGCNLCDVDGRTFGIHPSTRTVYDSFRRYTNADDLAGWQTLAKTGTSTMPSMSIVLNRFAVPMPST